MGWFSKVVGKLFGGDKGLVEQVSDVADKWKPSPTTKHKMSLEESAKNEESVQNARALQFQLIGEGKFSVFVAGMNGIMRPLFGTWAFIVLVGATFGFIQSSGFSSLDSFSQGLVVTIVNFLFGVRIISQDIPNAAVKILQALAKRK